MVLTQERSTHNSNHYSGDVKRRAILLKAQLASARFFDFCQFVDPSYNGPPHIRLLCHLLEKVERGEVKKLIVQIPPRHGKSETISVKFPAWYLGRHPDQKIIHASYAANLSNTFSRRARGIVEDKRYSVVFPDVHTSKESRSVNEWTIAAYEGGVHSAGIGGSVTGHGAHVFIIDDPVKDHKEAESEVYRDRTWEWYRTTASTRLEPGAAIIILMARWHKDDLVGRILATDPEFELVNLPAIAEENDPLDRDPGEALWPERYDVEALNKIRERHTGTRGWAALYCGNPLDPESQIIRREWIRWYDECPPATLRGGGVDTATSAKTSADNMSMVDVCKDGEGFLLVDDSFLEKITVSGFAEHVCNQHRIKNYLRINIESNNAGEAVKQRIDELGRETGTYPPTNAEATTTDKVIRVMEYQHLIENGTIRFKRGHPGVAKLVDHLCAFDGKGGTVDDDVDALGFAIKAVIGGGQLGWVI